MGRIPRKYPASTPQVPPQVKELILVLENELNREEIQSVLNISDRKYLRNEYLNVAVNEGFVEMTQPDSPNSPTQKYRLTQKGEEAKEVFLQAKTTPQVNEFTPQVIPQVISQITPQVQELLLVITGEHKRNDLQRVLKLADREYFRQSYLTAAIDLGLLELTQPNSPNSPTQKYRLTEMGKGIQKWLLEKK